VDIDTIKKITVEDLTDEEAKDLLKKIDKAKRAYKKNKPFLTFDWARAIMLIHAHDIQNAAFGLKGDWSETSAIGLKDGQPTEPLEESKFGYAITSNWATPVLYDIDQNQCYECYRVANNYESQRDVDPWWPEEAQLSFDFIKEILDDMKYHWR